MLNRTKAPDFSQDFSFELPQPEIISLRGGSRVIWLKGIQQDVFKIELVFSSNKWNEPVKGLSHFLALMLDKGTSTQTSSQISNTLDYHGAQLEITPGPDFTSVSLYGLNKYLRNVFSLVLKLITESIFPEAELQLQKDIFSQNLKVNKKKTSFIASKLLRQNIFGKEHPYGSSIEENDLNEITSNKLADFFRNSFCLKDAFLVGNFLNDEIDWVVDELKSLTSKPIKNILDITVHQGSNVRVQELNGVQSTLRLGKRFLNRNHIDYPSCLITNHILGGYFGSRLMKNIREEKGLTYGIYSSIQAFQKDCFLSIGADVNTDKVDLALLEIKNEMVKLIENQIPDDELTIAKNHFLGSLQLEISNPFSSIEKIKTIFLNELSLNFYGDLFTSIKDFNPPKLKSVASKYLAPDSLNIVVVS